MPSKCCACGTVYDYLPDGMHYCATTPGVSRGGSDGTARENKDEPPGCANTATALTSPLLRADKEADVDIIAPSPSQTEQTPAQTIARLQHLLAESLLAREWALSRVVALEAMTDVKHWYVAGDGGYCQACGLPQSNRRHARKAA